MKTFKCDIEDGSFSLVASLVESTSSDSESYRVALNGKNGKAVASKTVAWPANIDPPSEISFCSSTSCVHLSNGQTIAKIPIKLRSLKLSNLGTTVTKRYKTFTTNPVPSSDESLALSSITDLLNKPTNEKKWRALESAISNCDLAGILPAHEQSLLLDVLKHIPSNNLLQIATALSRSRIFGFRSIEKFFAFCVEKAMFDVPLNALKDNGLVSEKILCLLLRHAVSCVPSDGMSILQLVLSNGFAKESMTREIPHILSTVESSQIIDWCFTVYSEKQEALAANALRLVAAIYDSEGSRFVWDTSVYEQIADASGFIADMALLSTLFSSFEMQRLEVKAQVLESVPPYRIVKMKLPVRKMIW